MITEELKLDSSYDKKVEEIKYFQEVYVPCNFNIDYHLRVHKPRQFKPSKDRLLYILNLLIEIPLRDKSLLDQIRVNRQIPFVKLSSQVLKAKIHNYQLYLHYLIESGVLETDNHYSIGKFSKGYRFTRRYRGIVTTKRITDVKLDDSEKYHRDLEEAKKIYPYLISWFDNLDFDRDSALKYLKIKFLTEVRVLRNKDVTTMKHNIYQCSVARFSKENYYFKVDHYSNRLHTNLSNLKSELRNFITFKGEKLTSIDLSGSQPFLILNLLNPQFYNSENDWFSLKKINYNLSILISPPVLCAPIKSIMCGTFEENWIIEEIETYKQLVKHNQFYEHCINMFSKIERKRISRGEVKEIIFSVLFSSNTDTNPFLVNNKRIFRAVFPFISSVLDAWKAEETNNLAKVLQKMESYLFLECITRKINDQRPDIPLFTIHDSIATTEKHVAHVTDIMFEEISTKTGYNPHFKTEGWTPNNLFAN
ncbi:hypothetical protein [Dyadobacter sp. LHD-138]|uniref:hypothetical protein n=1 Tax=Dyadobacter sp. LHD-138 TaxID=3071413 RepID=UPI0027DF6B9F|nr:hypothetical protein [Dyadobacter sp. LHD-138]MDQ6482569.1 hypothetical protein [Dyadobacter sp. LHD-138]